MINKLKHAAIIIFGVSVILTIAYYGSIYVLSEYLLRQYKPVAEFKHSIPTDSASISYGKHIARTRGCFGCHGQKLEGLVFTEQWPWVKRAVAPNLVSHAKRYPTHVLEAAIRQGIGHDGRALWSMPSYNWVHLTDEDVACLIAFLKSGIIIEKELPEPELGFDARYNMVFGDEIHMAKWAQSIPSLKYSASPDSILRMGEYLTSTTCSECHGPDLKGDYQPDFITPSLAIIASYSEMEFRNLMRTGVSRNGRTDLGIMTVVAKDRFAYFTSDELSTIYAYLNKIFTTDKEID